MSRIVRIGSRKSALARIQSYLVAAALKEKYPDIQIQFLFKESLGDKDLSSPLWKMSGKGVFTRDFKEDILEDKVDLVVHSWKDLELEEDGQTEILSILQREDQRDILLFKTEAYQNPNYSEIRLMSSSPRREYNLGKFFSKALPKNLQQKSILFEPVRGNIQTRIRKWQENPGIQGIILAKAALDRMLAENFPECKEEEFVQIRSYLRIILQESLFMVLPLSENPNAPAQGALAVEIKSERNDLKTLLEPLQSGQVRDDVFTERRELRKYGGGCHQKIGVACFSRNYGKILITRGETDNGEVLNGKALLNSKKQPVSQKPEEELWPLKGKALKFNRNFLSPVSLPEGPLFITRSTAWQAEWTEKETGKRIIWSAGVKTWYDLAAFGLWVHGTADSFGEEEESHLGFLLGEKPSFIKLSHLGSEVVRSDYPKLPTYSLQLQDNVPVLSSKKYFYWMSGSQFDLMLRHDSKIAEGFHASGPGITAKHIQNRLGSDSRVDIFLDYQDWLNYHGIK